MKRTISIAIHAIVAITVITLALIAGSVLGRRSVLNMTTQFLREETRRELSSAVEVLANLRNGDFEKATEALEVRLDARMETLPRSVEWSALPYELQHAYMIGKAYRSRYPPTNASADLARALSTIPFPNIKDCSPALQRALEP